MVKLVYSAMMSLDGFIEDRHGNFDWAEPDREVHTFINDLEARHGTHLYGRAMYEVMAVWENDELIRGMPDYAVDFARIWRAAEKIVYSATLERVSTARTRLEPKFRSESVRALKASSERDITIAGPNLAAHAFHAGLVDECLLFVAPTSVGGGKSAMPLSSVVSLALVEERRFSSGFIFLRYKVKLPSSGVEG